MQVDFARYKGLLKNQKVVDELEQTFKSFKPVDYDVAAQIKAIDAFQEKAVSAHSTSSVQSRRAKGYGNGLIGCRLTRQRKPLRKSTRSCRLYKLH